MCGAKLQTAKVSLSASLALHRCPRIRHVGTALVPRAALNRRVQPPRQPSRTERGVVQPRCLVPWLVRQLRAPHPCSVRCRSPPGSPQAPWPHRLESRPHQAQVLVYHLQQVPQHHHPKPNRKPQRRGATPGCRRQGRRRRCPVLSGPPARPRWTRFVATQACLPDPCVCSANARKHKTQRTRPARSKSARPERMPSASTPDNGRSPQPCSEPAIILGSAALSPRG